MKLKRAIQLIELIVISTLSATAAGQTLADVERLQQRSLGIAACERLAEQGVRDPACRQSAQLASPSPASPPVIRQAAPQVISYRAIPMSNGVIDAQVEVVLDERIYRLTVGDTAKGWRLLRLTDYEAVFAKGRRQEVIAFRARIDPSLAASADPIPVVPSIQAGAP